MTLRIALLSLLLRTVFAAQPSAPSPVAAPLRKLPWGQLNFLHTTDTHGWHGGHLQEAQYSADWGDYISFAHHLRQRADQDGSDLLLVDTGDRVEGNGLYDASQPKGTFTSDIIKHQQMDVIVCGNHELYIANTSMVEYETTVPNFKEAYIASNVNIRHPKSGELVPLAPRYRKFTTKNQGIRVLAFGFLFNFQGNADNTVVQTVQEAITEQWFQDAIRSKDVDLFLVAGHVPVHGSTEFDAIYAAIRGAAWDVPIVFFGGHTHIRDYKKWEKKAVGIESGRYMETIGFLSISGLSSKTSYQRLYIDNNLFSMHEHSGTNSSNFDTDLGRNVSQQIASARKDLRLDHAYGCAPHDYWLNRAPYPSDSSLLTWLETQFIPDTFNGSKQTIVLSNSGALRFDIFKGPFTIDSTYLLSPFTSGFHVLKDVPYAAASQVLRLLNNEGPILPAELMSFAREAGISGLGELIPHLPVSEHQIRQQDQVPILADRDLTPGYTTRDDAGTDGDDTIHQEIQFYGVPNCIGANIGFNPDAFRTTAVPETVDLAYNEFIEGWVLAALRYLGIKYSTKDAEPLFNGASVTQLISKWVHKHWQCE